MFFGCCALWNHNWEIVEILSNRFVRFDRWFIFFFIKTSEKKEMCQDNYANAFSLNIYGRFFSPKDCVWSKSVNCFVLVHIHMHRVGASDHFFKASFPFVPPDHFVPEFRSSVHVLFYAMAQILVVFLHSLYQYTEQTFKQQFPYLFVCYPFVNCFSFSVLFLPLVDYEDQHAAAAAAALVIFLFSRNIWKWHLKWDTQSSYTPIITVNNFKNVLEQPSDLVGYCIITNVHVEAIFSAIIVLASLSFVKFSYCCCCWFCHCYCFKSPPFHVIFVFYRINTSMKC